jgi:uncharacterized protein (TIGR00725 family)
MPHRIIGIIGGHSGHTTVAALQLAEAIGAEVGRRGMAVVCGGGDGVMEAACRGCRASGGVTIGVLKGNTSTEANPYIVYPILTSMDVASNNVIVWTAAGLIAFDGRYGTLNEIALALDFGRPLVLVGREGLLNVAAVTSDRFSFVDLCGPAGAPAILDRLEEMITRSRT